MTSAEVKHEVTYDLELEEQMTKKEFGRVVV